MLKKLILFDQSVCKRLWNNSRVKIEQNLRQLKKSLLTANELTASRETSNNRQVSWKNLNIPCFENAFSDIAK